MMRCGLARTLRQGLKVACLAGLLAAGVTVRLNAQSAAGQTTPADQNQAAPANGAPAQGTSPAPIQSTTPTQTPAQAPAQSPAAPSAAPLPGELTTPAQGNATTSGQNGAAAQVPNAAPVQGTAPVQNPEQSPANPSAAPLPGELTTPVQGGDASQEPDADQSSVFVFKKEVQEVILHATVIDEQRNLVPNLDKQAFSVFEDRVPQKITSFRQEDVPVEMGIVVDNSGSMQDKRAKVTAAVLNLVRASNPQDQIFVVNFAEDVYLDQDFTSDIHLLERSLDQVTMRGDTALYDAIVASAMHLKNSKRLEKKVLLVITDGQDNVSQESLMQAQRVLQQPNGPVVYVVGLLGDNPRRLGRDALQSLADASGGVSFFPQTLDDVDGITRTVAHDIRRQYTIGYKSSNANKTGEYRTIQVEAQARPYRRLTVRTRSGYYEGEPLK